MNEQDNNKDNQTFFNKHHKVINITFIIMLILAIMLLINGYIIYSKYTIG